MQNERKWRVSSGMMTDYAKRRTKVIRKLKVLATPEGPGMGAKNDIQYMLQQLPPESQIKTARQRRGAMAALEQAEKSDLYSVSGQRRIAKHKMEKLEKKGVKFKTYKELNEFGEFMESVRDYSLGRVYDSTKALELFIDRGEKSGDELLNQYREWQKAKRGIDT